MDEKELEIGGLTFPKEPTSAVTVCADCAHFRGDYGGRLWSMFGNSESSTIDGEGWKGGGSATSRGSCQAVENESVRRDRFSGERIYRTVTPKGQICETTEKHPAVELINNGSCRGFEKPKPQPEFNGRGSDTAIVTLDADHWYAKRRGK